MEYFTYITGIATLIGLALQVVDAFPIYKSYREKIFYVLLGLFLGSLVTAFDGSEIQFSIEISGFVLLIALVAFVILWSLHIAYKKHRGEFFGVAFISLLVFLLILGAGNIESPSNERAKLTINELIFLSELSIEKGNYDRAIRHHESILSKLSRSDVRYQTITKKIEELKAIQLSGL